MKRKKFESFQKPWRHFKVLFEDSDFLIVDKAAGTAVHAGYNIDRNLVDEVKEYLGISRSDILANRLEKKSTGM